MRRSVAAIGTAALLSLPVAALAQIAVIDEEATEPLGWLVDLVDVDGVLVLEPSDDVSSALVDPDGDFEHSSGNPPGFTPDHIDITHARVFRFDAGDAPLFGPTDDAGTPWAVGQRLVDSAGGPIQTYTGDSMPYDGSQYDGGAYLFGMNLAETPPAAVPGRCEFVVWLHDTRMPTRWENQPGFPSDPAGGTNMAFGIGLNPEGQGVSGTFTLDLGESGFFEPKFDYDVRGFVVDGFVGIFVPQEAAPEFDAVNFYSFCVEDGFSFAPDDTGSDQTGLIDVTPSELPSLVVGVAVPTTVTLPPPSAVASTTTTQAPTTTTPDSTTTSQESEFPWWLLVIGGLALFGAGLWIFTREQESNPCADELAAWKQAREECTKAARESAEAQEKSEDARAEREDLEDERKEVCRDWPPACWDNEDGAWVEDEHGNRITSRDLHMRRMAMGELWADYQAGRVSAEQVQEVWRKADTPAFREEMRDRDVDAGAELERIDGELARARQAETAASDAAEAAAHSAREACAAAEAARRAYEECVGTAVAGAPAGPGGDEDGLPTGPGTPGASPGGEKSGSDPCEGKPLRKVEPAGRPEQVTITVDFALIVEAWEGSERNAAAGEQLVFDLSRVAQDLNLAGNLLAAREAGLHVAGGVNGYTAGTYVVGAGGVVRGGIETLQAAEVLPSVPTSIPTAITETLESVAKLGAFVAGKVTEWMTNYQIMEGRLTYFTQQITATPYLVYECRKGVGYVCVEKVWEFEIGNLRRLAGPRTPSRLLNNDLDRIRFQNSVRRLAAVAASRIRRDAERLADWRRRHEPGPCP